MPQHKSCEKRMKTSKEENIQNRAGKSVMKGALKRALASKSKDEALPLIREATSTLDKLVHKGIIHMNKAANHKSALATHLNRLA